MLTMNEIVGEQQWTFRFRLEDAEDDYLHQLLEDGRSLRRLLPPMVSLDEAHSVIRGLLSDRRRRKVEAERRERRRLARIAKAQAKAQAKADAERQAALPAGDAVEGVSSAPGGEMQSLTPSSSPSDHDDEAAQASRQLRWTDMLYNFFGGK